MNQNSNNPVKLFLYKLYVVGLLLFVVWVAQFIFPLIFWEYQYTGVAEGKLLDGNESRLEKLATIRKNLDTNLTVKRLDLGDTVITQNRLAGHFHHIGDTMVKPPINGCDYCHTTMPHQKHKETRAFINMHGFSMTCETCHFDQVGNKSAPYQYNWMLSKSKEIVKRPAKLLASRNDPESSTHLKDSKLLGARITPMLVQDGKRTPVTDLSALDDAMYFLKNYSDLPEKIQSNTLKEMHNRLNKKPLQCEQCHVRKNLVFPYSELGYPEQRIKQLTRADIVKVVREYKKFYFTDIYENR